jgi:hypothetical protein
LRVGRDGKARRCPQKSLLTKRQAEKLADEDAAALDDLNPGGREPRTISEFADAVEAAAQPSDSVARCIGTLHDWQVATDGLTRALSYALTYRPPLSIPDNYISVAEFKDRVGQLGKAVEEWRLFESPEALERIAAGNPERDI